MQPDELKEAIKTLRSFTVQRDTYKFAVKQSAEDIVDIIYGLEKTEVGLVRFIVVAVCTFNAKIGDEKKLLKFVTILEKRIKKEKKFRRNIVGALNFCLNVADAQNEQDDADERHEKRQEAALKEEEDYHKTETEKKMEERGFVAEEEDDDV